jgi:RNA polymerase sigma-70 factor (ECF subfamily)
MSDGRRKREEKGTFNFVFPKCFDATETARCYIYSTCRKGHAEAPAAFSGNIVGPRTSKTMAGKKPGETGTDKGRTVSFEDSALVERVRKGDMQAFGSLVAKYQDRVYNMILRMCGREADAEELSQETFLRALERIRQFTGRSEFYTWLFRVAANLTISHRRRAVRIHFQSLSTDEQYSGTQADALTAAVATQRDPPPQTMAMTSETRQRVLEALECLDDEFRTVVVLCDIEEMDYTQAAEVTGVPVGTVKSRLHRARCILKDRLADLVA